MSRSRAICKPSVAAFEITGRCALRCRHCRAAAHLAGGDPLTTQTCKAILKGLAEYNRCIVIFTGGEPMLRGDIVELVGYARQIGHRPVMATCGWGLADRTVGALKKAGLLSFSFSLDGADAESHDAFRQTDGAFELAMAAISAAKRAGLRFQINTTLTRLNANRIEQIAQLAVQLGAACWNPFILVPVGRAKEISDLLFSPDEYERLLEQLARLKERLPIDLRLTCGPQFARILRQKKISGGGKTPGCLAATEFVFISHTANVQTCGFLDQSAGNLIEANFDFGAVWENSPLLNRIRDIGHLQGACGQCAYAAICRGCRARALQLCGDMMAEDPICLFAARQKKSAALPEAALSAFQKEILRLIQEPLPICDQPFDALADKLGCATGDLLAQIQAFKDAGWVRRYRAQVRYGLLGRCATLAAVAVAERDLPAAVERINALVGVSHHYQRSGRLNLWFTVQAIHQGALTEMICHLNEALGVRVLTFPALRTYKLDVRFDPSGATEDWFRPRGTPSAPMSETPVVLTELEKRALAAIQTELPLVERPFAALLGQIPVGALQSLADKGVIAKIAAVVDYLRLGFAANAMVCAAVPSDTIDAVGRAFAAYPAVSHCYWRQRADGWPYDLFAMLHGDTLPRLEAFAQRFFQSHGIADWVLLPTVKEWKKKPVIIDIQ